jgi:WD40 repeat protein
VESLRFSPDGVFLISLGDQNDRGLFVWKWKEERKMCQNKLSKPVLALAFSPEQDFFVTGGYQHLKYWYMDEDKKEPLTRQNGNTAIMESQAADLEKVKFKVFVGVSIYEAKVYSLASDGHVYVFDKQRTLVKWMNIRVDRAFGCQVSQGRLFCACSDGVLRVFKTENLQHIVTMAKPPPLGQTNILVGVSKIKIPTSEESRFADIVCCIVDETFNRIVALYSDRMMFIWDIKQFDSLNVYRTFLSHRGPIHDIQLIPNSLPVGIGAKPNALQLTA